MRFFSEFLGGGLICILTSTMVYALPISETLSSQELARIKTYASGFKQVKSTRSLLDKYQQAKVIQTYLKSKLDISYSSSESSSSLQDRVFIKKYLPGFKLWHNGDGAFIVSLMYQPFLNQAQATPLTIDEQFFTLLIRASAPERLSDYWPAWNRQTWDLGGCNELGKGVFFELLQAIDKIGSHQQYLMVKNEVVELKAYLLEALLKRQDVVEVEPAYCHSSSLQLQELLKIRKTFKFTPDELKKLDSQIRFVKEKAHAKQNK